MEAVKHSTRISTLCSFSVLKLLEISGMEASLREDLGADSLSAVELIMALEDNFDIKISDEEMKEILTVGDLVNYIDSHVEQ